MKTLQLTKDQFARLHPTEYFLLTYFLNNPKVVSSIVYNELNYLTERTIQKYLRNMEAFGYIKVKRIREYQKRNLKCTLEVTINESLQTLL